MYQCDKCGGRFTMRHDVHAPKAVWIGQPIFVPCDGVLVEVDGNVLLDGLPADTGYSPELPSRDMIIGQYRAR